MNSETYPHFEAHERLWKRYRVDKNLKDEWLEKLNSFRTLELISICEGHADAKPNSLRQYSHVHFDLSKKLFSYFDSTNKNWKNIIKNKIDTIFDIPNNSLNFSHNFSIRKFDHTSAKDSVILFKLRHSKKRESLDLDLKTTEWFENVIIHCQSFDNYLSKLCTPVIEINAEDLAYWYFRLNGFFTIKNLVVHLLSGFQGTDGDVVGVRFPHRREIRENKMIDDRKLIIDKKIHVVICEVKSNEVCKINRPFRNPESNIINRILDGIGILSFNNVDDAASLIYRDGAYEDDGCLIEIIAIGTQQNPDLNREKKKIKQIVWSDVLSFIYDRHNDRILEKQRHPQWDETGKLLWDTAIMCTSKQEFISKIHITSSN
ncbi:MAG: hypothetical protein KJ666_00625 [Bacteroidetes bacterium]|nr:hypothetical protein [Bacteroidota bacterium]MBU2584847.1 hypothetical protein [Bacteroidota bacterium]